MLYLIIIWNISFFYLLLLSHITSLWQNRACLPKYKPSHGFFWSDSLSKIQLIKICSLVYPSLIFDCLQICDKSLAMFSQIAWGKFKICPFHAILKRRTFLGKIASLSLHMKSTHFEGRNFSYKQKNINSNFT